MSTAVMPMKCWNCSTPGNALTLITFIASVIPFLISLSSYFSIKFGLKFPIVLSGISISFFEAEERMEKGLARKNALLEDSNKTLQDARGDCLQEFEKIKGLTKTFENALTSLPERALDSVNRLAVTAEQTGRELGRLEAFSAWANFISRGEGELGILAYSTIIVLRRLSERLPSNPMLQMDIDRVTKGLEGLAAGD